MPPLDRATARFDRVVKVDLQDEQGRRDILKVHTHKLTLADPSTIDVVATLTAGQSGAELAALVNEAAIRTVRRQGDSLTTEDFIDAFKTSTEARGQSGTIAANMFKNAVGLK